MAGCSSQRSLLMFTAGGGGAEVLRARSLLVRYSIIYCSQLTTSVVQARITDLVFFWTLCVAQAAGKRTDAQLRATQESREMVANHGDTLALQ